MSVGKFDSLNPILFNLLNGSIRKDTLLFSIFENAFNGAIWKDNLLGLIREVLLNLVVLELENLEFVWKGGLSRLSFGKVVYDLSVRIRLLNVLIVEVDNCVAVRVRFPFHPIVENYLFFARSVNSLDFTICAHILLDYLLVGDRFRVVLIRKV